MNSETLEEARPEQEETKDRLTWLAAQLEAGFEQLHCLKKKGLDLALHYGPFLLEWKELVGHGGWQKDVREKVKGADLRTCNRWKRIAEHRTDVDDALTRWPDVKWGLVRMLDYLSGKFDPNNPNEYEDDGGDGTAPVEAPPTSAGPSEVAGLGSATTDGQETVGEATTPPTIRFPTLAQAQPGVNGTAPPPAHGRGKKPRQSKPPVPDARAGATEYEVEIVKVLKVIVPRTVTENVVKQAFENRQVQFRISVEDQAWTISDEGLPGKVKHVNPWG